MKPVINHQNCMVEPEMCMAMPVCDTGALHYAPNEQHPELSRMVIDYDLCNGCGACADECCGDAIDMKEVLVVKEFPD